MENLALRVFIAQTAKEDVRSDISVMKRAAEKAESVMNNTELDKQRQGPARGHVGGEGGPTKRSDRDV